MNKKFLMFIGFLFSVEFQEVKAPGGQNSPRRQSSISPSGRTRVPVISADTKGSSESAVSIPGAPMVSLLLTSRANNPKQAQQRPKASIFARHRLRQQEKPADPIEKEWEIFKKRPDVSDKYSNFYANLTEEQKNWPTSERIGRFFQLNKTLASDFDKQIIKKEEYALPVEIVNTDQTTRPSSILKRTTQKPSPKKISFSSDSITQATPLPQTP